MADELVHEGVLTMLVLTGTNASIGFRIYSKKKRYVVFTKSQVMVYENCNPETPVADRRVAFSAPIDGSFSLSKIDPQPPNTEQFTFTLRSPSLFMGHWMFQAASEDEKDIWVNAFEKEIGLQQQPCGQPELPGGSGGQGGSAVVANDE